MNKKNFLLLVALFWTSTLFCQVDPRGYIVKTGDKAPDFSTTLDTGEAFSLKANRGKVIMLQFTASWCGVCRKEMPHIEKDIWQKHKDKGLIVVGIDRDEPLETLKKFSRETGITYPLALDPNADIFGLFAEKKAGVTRNVLINKEGEIVLLTRLFNEEEFARLVQKIDELMQ
jgi:peroxiredoxin